MRQVGTGRRVVLAGLAVAAAGRGALAQTASWAPTRQVRIICPFPPGGAADLLSRALAEEIAGPLGQAVVVENRAGAGGSIGTEAAIRAPADGHTLVMGSTGPNAMNPALFNLPFDPARDLAPVTMVATVASILVVHPAVPAQTLPELLALVRARPGQLSYASAGNGSSIHLFMEQLKALAGVDIAHVPYRGGGPAMVDVIAGRVAMMFDTIPTAMPHVRDGRVRVLAVSTAIRHPTLPQVPTVAEAGVPGFEAVGFYGLLVPLGTPEPAVTRINQEVAAALAQPAFRARLESIGVDPAASTPAEFAAFVARDRARWTRLVRDAGIRPD
ncbi:Bug family tripartite tricarboxylate transporter substrate binding protein [Falsiroseomonas oryzae]|uniref:Bug family tripartite tricarboxylate transporter substrate binding protein n=1 Tax=Falsiroseomonas oryzae TaxID=2766473 RepID=UPI0022EB211E|nr:tripartite tricarboxylate transporter substrate binding protein [Roseomonas sp. MO-31]